MYNVTSTEFSKNFGRYRDVAQREPVAVTSHDRITGYFVSTNEYQEYQKLKSLMPKAYAIEELQESTIQALMASKMDSRHDTLNSLLD